MVLKLDPIPLPDYKTSREAALAAGVAPIDVFMCSDCGHVQLLDIPEAVFDDYSYHSGQAKVMLDHFAVVAKRIIETYRPKPGSLIVDIGSNDGSFLRHFKDAGYRVVGVELDKAIAEAATANGVETVGAPLSLEVADQIVREHGNAAVVLAFNVFAHTDDLKGMAQSVQRLMEKDGLFVFEAQYLLDVVQRTLVATFFHEHLSHHSVRSLKSFLGQFFMEMIDVERVPIQHGSIIGYVQFCEGGRKATDRVQKLLDLEASVGLGKIETVRGLTQKIGALRASVAGLARRWLADGSSVAAYGAARSGPGLISMLGLKDSIEYIVDDHPHKVGRYSPVDAIPVLPTSELLKRMPDYCVLLAWVPAQRIIEANQEYLRRGGKFVVLCPEFRVIQEAVYQRRRAA